MTSLECTSPPIRSFAVFGGILLLILSYKGVVASDDEQMFSVRPESVEVRSGEDVLLRCIVDNQQGKAQWTKDGFALGFERDVPGYPRYSYLGDASQGEHHLVIKGVTLEDDGEYQCQVGPTMTTTAIWAAANVTVMVAPNSVRVMGQGDGSVVQVVEGKTLKLQCLVSDARPPAQVAWYKDGLMLDPESHEEVIKASPHPRRWNTRSSLLLRPGAEQDGHQYSCRALHPALRDSPTTLVASLTLAVLHPPEAPFITGYKTGEVLLVGERRTLTCQVMGGNPRPRITWYRHGRPLDHGAPEFKDLMDTEAATDAPTAMAKTSVRVVSVNQRIRGARAEDGAMYECRITNDLLRRPLTTNVTLTVHYGATRAVISGPSVVAAEEEFSLTCLTSAANPPATISWWVQGAKVTTPTQDIREDEGGGYVTSSNLTHRLLKSHHVTEATFECRARSPATDSEVITRKVISVIKPPGWPDLKLEGVGEGQEVMTDAEVGVVCATKGGNPRPTIRIYKGHEKVSLSLQEEEDRTTARGVMQVIAADNGAQIICEVTNPATDTPLTAATTIKVLFPAWEVSGWVTPGSVEAGQVATLTCESSSSLPPSTLTWHSLGTTLSSGTVAHSQGVFGGTVTKSELKVKSDTEDNGRVFTCDADNGIGVSVTTNVTLNVLHGPTWVAVPAATVDVIEGEDLLLSASATANPGPIRYSWWRGPAALEDGDDDDDEIEGKLHLKRVLRHMAGDYCVMATSPRGELNATFTINVLYGPEDVMAAERMTVDEDGSATILCSAVGNPTPNVTWSRDNSSTAPAISWGEGEAKLVVEWAGMSDTGLYYCHAYNSVSRAIPTATALVVTQAPSTSDSRYGDNSDGTSWAVLGGVGRLDCRVKAAPAPSFTWSTGVHRVLHNNKKYSIHVPQLVDGVVEWSSVLEVHDMTMSDYAVYTCSAHNSRGSQDTNFTLAPPILPLTPINFTISRPVSSTVILSWISNLQGAPPSGFTVKYRAADADTFEYLDVHGGNITGTTISDLALNTEYSFAIQAYNDRGYSNYTLPIAITTTLLGMVTEIVSSSTVGGQGRFTRLIILLISLTGTALLVLNISIIVCYVRRRAMNRNLSASSSKATELEVYTPTLGSAAHGDHLPLTSTHEAPPPDYQTVECQTSVDECEHTSLLNHQASAVPPQPHTTPPLASAAPRSKSNSPRLNGGMQIQGSKNILQNGEVPSCDTLNIPTPTIRLEEDLKASDEYSVPIYTEEEEQKLSGDYNSSNYTIEEEDESPREYNISSYSLNNPDVCPNNSSSLEPLIQHQQESYLQYTEEDQVSLSSHHSNNSYRYSPGHLAQSHPPAYQSQKPTTQVIFHGQPHIQQQIERQQQQQQQQQHHQQHHQLQYGQQPVQSPKHQHPHQHHHQQQQQHLASSPYTCLNPAGLSTLNSSCCDIPYRQPPPTDASMSYGTIGPRRSCLKASHHTNLQRSHSAHDYHYASPYYRHNIPDDSPDPHDPHDNAWCNSAICRNPPSAQSHQNPRTACRATHEYPTYYTRSQSMGSEYVRHDSFSGVMPTYKLMSYGEPNVLREEPDVVQMETSSNVKRVGWKEGLHDSPGRGTLASRASTDTSSSTTSTVTLGPTKFQHQHSFDAERSKHTYEGDI